MKQPLLEYLKSEIGCAYLSDLHQEIYLEQISDILSSLPESDYPLGEWNEAARYVLHTGISFSSAAEVVKSFRDRLE